MEAVSGQRPKTRTRILAACHRLFNERGAATVTTAEIAAAVGINEGNLYYHFQRKEQMLEALFDAFEQEINDVATADLTQGAAPERYADYLAGWFNLMWEWRFFYRDGEAVYRMAASLRPRLQRLSADGQDQIRRALGGMRAAGLIRADDEEVERLIVNSWIVSTYWIDYLRTRHGIVDISRDDIAWGASQVMSLFVPYMTPAGLAMAAVGPGGRKA